MIKSKEELRRRAINRGLEFIYQTACDQKNFAVYGFDYLSCFRGIALTSKDTSLRNMALRMGRERARYWRHENSDVPLLADADSILQLIQGSSAADGLGVPGKRLKKQLQRMAANFTARDFLGFEPEYEPPPTDVPEECECGTDNLRGRKRCIKCRRGLSMLSSYAVWLDALAISYTGERYGIKLGASFAEVIKWLPHMRPYPESDNADYDHFHWAIYAVTHVVYSLNDYSVYRLSKNWLPQEYTLLRRHLQHTIAMGDPETTGEILDSLRSFGVRETDPLMRMGVDYLLSEQNPDGSWGATQADDIYERYHPTWTAIDGLREYAWQGVGLSFPKLRPLLLSWARQSCPV